MKISSPVRTIITQAYNIAKIRNHEYLTPEHILYAALDSKEIQTILEACGARVEQLKHDLEIYFKQKIPVIAGVEPIQTVHFQSVIDRAVISSHAAQKETLDAPDRLVSP
jgi:ATP-dependent Clp protease ATP-binding subunit ClpA